MQTNLRVVIMLILSMISVSILAQRNADIENSKDHPLLSRFSSSVIEFYYETKWGAYKLPVSDKGKVDFDKPMVLEGKITRIQYSAKPDNSAEYVMKNYQAALKNSGYTIMIAISGGDLGFSDRPHTWQDKYYDEGGFYNGLGNKKFGEGVALPSWKNDRSFIAAKGIFEGKDIYITTYTVVDEKYTLIIQDIIEAEPPETGLVTAEIISKGIAANGHIAIYNIFFNTGKADIKAESSDALKNIAEFIKANTPAKYYIVGHTDNTGSLNDNLALSENRAKAVMTELVARYGVNQSQLNVKGIASYSPVSSNSTENGRARNRRVEIVEQ